jgi:fumarate reductase subunit C
MEGRLYLAQRLSAMVLAPLVVGHLALIFYAVFAVAAAVHAPIGLRNVLREWTRLPRGWIDGGMLALFFVFLFLGLRAVRALAGA